MLVPAPESLLCWSQPLSRKLLVIQSREVGAPERCFTSKFQSGPEFLAACFTACDCSLEVVVKGGSTVYTNDLFYTL